MVADTTADKLDETTSETGLERLHQLICSLQECAAFGHPADSFELVETHISYVLLTGEYAYKFKKPVNLGFLDFTSLAKRKFYCEEEVRLNRRFSPEIYLGVIGITGSHDRPVINGEGDVLEYAVKMVQFPKGSELEQILEADQLTPAHIDDLAMQIADFHQRAAIASEQTTHGTTDEIRESALENFTAIMASSTSKDYKSQLKALEQWTGQLFRELNQLLNDRRSDGFIRECHGDLHLGNIVLLENKPVLFDCIEFSEDFRWIDVINEIAFLVMDLDAHGRPELARRMLNDYLEIGGDYNGLRLLPLYYVYRAMVRCKVADIRLQQHDLTNPEKDKEWDHFRHYLDLALQHMQSAGGILIITHGMSGSGKTTLTQPILENLGAIRIRSDVERKRLHGLGAGARTGSELQAGIYTQSNTEDTYAQLLGQAKVILQAGYPVIVDATFLQKALRVKFQHLAQKLKLPFLILDFQAHERDLRQRIQDRQKQGKDASEAGLGILEYQIKHQEPLSETEINRAIVFDTSAPVHEKDFHRICRDIKDLLQG